MIKTKVRHLLKKKLSEAKKKNPAFSLRAFAKHLNLNPSALSEILSGKRPLSDKKMQEILSRLQLSDGEQKEVSELLQRAERGRVALSAQDSANLCRWQHFAILALLEIDHPPREASGIAKKMGCDLPSIQKALDLLEKAGMLKLVDGEYHHSTSPLTTTDGVTNQALLNAHIEEMQLAQKAALAKGVDERDLVSITFPASKKNLPKAKAEVRKFLKKLSDQLVDVEKDEVYTCAVYLYPLTGWEKKLTL